MKPFNFESDPPPDPTLSKAPEERADNRFCILPLWLRRADVSSLRKNQSKSLQDIPSAQQALL
jgi:hypothetical protein